MVISVMAGVFNLREEKTSGPVDAATKGAHKSASVLVAEGAVEQEITSGIDGHETIEDVAKSS